jgi:hypothetical protein
MSVVHRGLPQVAVLVVVCPSFADQDLDAFAPALLPSLGDHEATDKQANLPLFGPEVQEDLNYP